MLHESRDPEPLAESIARLIAQRGLARSKASEQLAFIWREVAGDNLESGTRVINLKRGVLNIAVSSAALLNELVSFHQADLLLKLQEEHPDLKVRGIEKLRVVDGSAMPDLTSAHINSTILMMAEKASDMILGRKALPAEQVN